jgi:putative OPT family oligopeptide transporter
LKKSPNDHQEVWMHVDNPKGLPENAYRKLNDKEEYVPVMKPDSVPREVTAYSLGWGIFYSILFSMAAAYLGLKIGQVFEAAIPIAIMAVGMSTLLKRKGALGENIIIQSIGSSSGLIVAGAIFTLPGLYILGIEASFIQVFLSSLLGGFLGILFLIPFRKYFVKDMHGEFPFPEATATTEVLVAGEAGGGQAGILVKALLIGGIYDFFVTGFGFWKEVISTRVFSWGQKLAQTAKLEFRIMTSSAVIGLGYIIGLKYSLIIACGSFLSWWLLIPAMTYLVPAENPIAQMLPGEIFSQYVRHIGIGAIAVAGIIGIIKSRSIILGAFKLAKKELFSGKKAGTGSGKKAVENRWQLDISMKWNTQLILATLVGVFAFFLIGVLHGNWLHALVGLLIVAIISFLFTTVAARAIAIVGTNPVSGMTLMTLIISSVILVSVGLKGDSGILAALLIGGVVCTALSMAGGFITDLKIGYWLGATPRHQERYKFLGVLLSAASVGLVILMLHKTYGFGPGGLEAPQASAMAAVIKPLMTGQSAPWLLYVIGGILAIVLEFIGIPPLAFALGMYLPIHLNTPLLAGGIIAHLVGKSKGSEALVTRRKEKGTLIASGFIAGGAIFGVINALLTYLGQEVFNWGEKWSVMKMAGTEAWNESSGAELLGFVMLALLMIYLWWDSRRVKIEEGEE